MSVPTIPCETCGFQVPIGDYFAHALACSYSAVSDLNPGFPSIEGEGEDEIDYDANTAIQESMGGSVCKACKDINLAAPVVDDHLIDECAVCLSPAIDFSRVRRARLCGHEFCAECMEKWLGEHTTCPLCVRDLSGDGGFRFVFDSDRRPTVPVIVISSYAFYAPPSPPSISESVARDTGDLIYHLGEMRHILGMGRW